MTGGYTMKEKNIRELAKRMGLITVENMCQYTIAQLVVMVANKVNELVDEVWRFETDVQEILKTQNENIQYLLGEGLHLEVENIFDGWLQDGTFDTLINQTALKKVNERIDETIAQVSDNTEKISNMKADLDVIKTNSKYMLELYVGDEGRQSTGYVTNHIKNGKKAGFNEICLLIYLQSDGTTLEDITRFDEYNQIARDLEMPITCLKLHGTYTYPNYLSTLYEGLSKLPDVTTVFIFNEQFKDVYSHGLNFPKQIKQRFPQVKKVGCTVDYGTAFKDWNPKTSDDIELLQSKYDILGVHMYPSCGNFAEARHTTYEQCIKAFNEFELLIPWKKEIWLTESGVLPYWQFLELPENYTIANLSDKERTIDPQRLFYRALFNCKLSQQAEIIIPWYTESWNYDDTVEMWEVIRHIIKNS